MFKKKNILVLLLCIVIYSFTDTPVSLFLIGDSISIEYYPYLKEDVSWFAILDRKQDDGRALQNLDIPMGANGGDSRMVLIYLRAQLAQPDFKPDYMLLNCGLHDIKRTPEMNEIQISQEEYRSNLTEIFNLLKQKRIKPIWITTTAVVDSIHNSESGAFRRYENDLLRYNEIAKEVCTKKNIPIIDLYSFTKELGVTCYRDHVHYDVETQKKQAKYIEESLIEIIR